MAGRKKVIIERKDASRLDIKKKPLNLKELARLAEKIRDSIKREEEQQGGRLQPA